MIQSTLKSFCGFILLLMVLGQVGLTICSAQSGSTTGSILGTVKDQQGATIAGVKIKVKQIETNFERTGETDEEGSYNFLQLPPGNYQLTLTAEGFKAINEQLTLTIGATLLSQFDMLPEASSETVVITATATNEVKTESSNINDLSRIDTLPINRRDFLDFALTSPRVTLDRVPNAGILATSGLSFNGQSGRLNNITIDGLDNNDTNKGAVRSTFSQEAVQEFQVVSDSYSAEFGRAIAGVVNIVTKSGGNGYHGNLFLFNRNDEISARNAFASFNPPYSQYQFGSVLSGAIKKDKLFFFLSFERLSIKQNNIVTISDQTVQAARQEGYSLINGPSPFAVGTSSFLARVDGRLGTNDTFWVRYNGAFTYNGASEQFGGLVGEENSGIQKVNDNSIAFNNTYINPKLNLVNETRFLYSRRNESLTPVVVNPEIQLLAPEGQVVFGSNGLLPTLNDQRIYQIVNNVSLIRGRNQLKFGADFNYTNRLGNTNVALFPNAFAIFTPLDFSQIFNMPGLPVLSGLQTFDPSLRTAQEKAALTTMVAPMLGFPAGFPLGNLSLPSTYIQAFGDTKIPLPEKFFSAFAQDAIKVKSNLLLSLGVRYDIVRLAFTPANDGNVSPRVGLAYRPNRIPKLAMHASFGIFFGVPFPSATVSTEATTKGLNLLFEPFPGSVIPFALPGHRFPSSDQFPAGVQFVPQFNVQSVYAPGFRNSYSEQANAGFDYSLDNNTTISLSYNYVRGIKLFFMRDINPVVHPAANPLVSLLTGRLDPTRGDVFEFESAFDSYYNGMTVSINRRLANKFSLFANYTLSKSIDDVGDFSFAVTDRPNNSLDPRAERGLSLQDVRNRFVFSGSWDLSYTKNRLLRDYQLSTIITLNSGPPYNLLAGEDINMNGDGGAGDRPAGLGRDVGIAPGFANVDMRFSRSVSIKERFRIQGFVEVFNLFNRVNIDPNELDRTFPPDAQGNFQLPPKEGGRYIVTPDRYRGSFPAREFQLGFKISF
jgi:hypothetical protein